MNVLWRTGLIVAIALYLFASSDAAPAYAAGNVTIDRSFQPSSADAAVQEQSPTTNFGSDTTALVQRKNAKDIRTLVTFDLSAIPTTATVNSGALSLWATVASAESETAWRVDATWAEGTVTWNNQPAATDTFTAVVPAAGENQWAVPASEIASLLGGTTFGWSIRNDLEATAGNKSSTYVTREGSPSTDLPKLAVNFTAVWDSYEDSGRTTVRDTYNSSFKTVFMRGTGFPASTFMDVSYYDAGAAGGQKIATDVVTTDGFGELDSSYLLTTDPAAVSGTWHAVAQPSTATVFPSNYNTLVAAGGPDTYDLRANDSFTVEPGAIPEFTNVVAGVAVALAAVAIYLWLRRRRLAHARVY